VLRSHLDTVRQAGYAVDDEEFDPGVRCLGAPVFDFRGKLAGAIGISGPSTRMSPDRLPELAAVVMVTARSLSERMTFSR
jgi:IclR family acetate operon transcriptional repressor